MPDQGHHIRFGAFLAPDARRPAQTVGYARLADRIGLDIVAIQDHPYHPEFFDAWTLLSSLAAQTERVTLFADVLNLPLRPPSVLAGSAASLDLLTGGRVELGLGTGVMTQGIEAMGGPVRTPGERVEAMAEAIGVLRALWTPGGPVHLSGKHYSLNGATPGPIPAHPIGIWVGAYKTRMLALTGRLADGWVPSSAYAPVDQLASMIKIIEDAAEAAGRAPRDVQRWYNIAPAPGFLDGPPNVWVGQLTELALTHGMSAFILVPGADPETELRAFAEEIAPGVRRAVDAERGVQSAELSPGQIILGKSGQPVTAFEEDRPHTPKHPDARTTPIGRASADFLIQVHEHLRQELAEIRRTIEQLATGRIDAGMARSMVHQTTMRQNYWSAGSFCASYCRLLTLHHTIEDDQTFTDLRAFDRDLTPVLDRLGEEHEIIADVLVKLDRALVAMVDDPRQLGAVPEALEELAELLLSHLAYEEEELLQPLARSTIRI